MKEVRKMGKYKFGERTTELYTAHRVNRNRWDDVEDLAIRYAEQIAKENSLTHGEAMVLLDRCKVILECNCTLKWQSQ